MSLEQIGQKLKTAREGQGLTLVQVYERTKIPLHHLQSIDTGNVDELPEPVYVAGFIKRYAEVVGLNGQALSDEYRKEATETNNGNGDGHFMRPVKASVSHQPVVVPAPVYMGKTRIDSGPPSIIKMLFFPAVMAIMIVGLLAFLLQWHSNNAANNSDQSVLSLRDATRNFSSVQPTTAAVPPPQTAPTQPATPQPPPTAESSISITANKHVWVDVSAISTGESLYTGFLESGDRRDFKDPKGVRVHAGNGGSVTVEADGKSAPLGAPGKISEKAYLAKGVAPADAALTPDGKTATGAGNVLGAGTTTPKPIVKKKAPKPAVEAERRKYRPIEEAPSRQYLPGESVGGRRSIDVPYRYNEGRLDTDNNN
jgi:cytoskeletal protein RodZ